MDNAIKYFYLLSTIILSTAFACAWLQGPISAALDFDYPVNFHMLTAIPSILMSFFACLGVLFYFIGTGTWIKDQAYILSKVNKEDAKRLWQIYEKANKFKGQAFPFPTFGIFTGILTFVLGGAIQMGALPHWVHPTLACILMIILWSGVPFIFAAVKKNVTELDKASKILDLNLKT